VYQGQPTVLIAGLFCGAFLASESGRRVLASVLLVLIGLKPQWLPLPALALARRDPRSVPVMLAAGVVILVLPFALVGPGGLLDYISLVLDRGEGDLNSAGYSATNLSWGGFLTAITGSTQPALTVLLGLLTLGLFAAILRQGEPRLTWAGAALVTLLVLPHAHPQDWVMVAPAAALLLSYTRQPLLTAVSAAGLLAVYIAANNWPAAYADWETDGSAVYWVTLANLAVILWIIALPALTKRLEARSAGGSEAVRSRPSSAASELAG
jgi:hypothetical protein